MEGKSSPVKKSKSETGSVGRSVFHCIRIN